MIQVVLVKYTTSILKAPASHLRACYRLDTGPIPANKNKFSATYNKKSEDGCCTKILSFLRVVSDYFLELIFCKMDHPFSLFLVDLPNQGSWCCCWDKACPPANTDWHEGPVATVLWPMARRGHNRGLCGSRGHGHDLGHAQSRAVKTPLHLLFCINVNRFVPKKANTKVKTKIFIPTTA